MPTAKVIEISASSKKSFEAAIQNGIEKAHESLDEVKAAWIKDQQVIVEEGKVAEYRVVMKVTFVLK